MADENAISVTFTVTQEMVDAFAELSGDYNSMHMNPEVARKSRYRQRVVHGMLPFSFLQLLNRVFDAGVEFTKLNTRFRKPIFIGDTLTMEVGFSESGGEKSYEAVWSKKDDDSVVIKSSGAFRLYRESGETGDGPGGFLRSDLDEAKHLIKDLDQKEERLAFRVSNEAKRDYSVRIFQAGLEDDSVDIKPGNNLVAVLMLSTLVGMRLPGRYAIFTRFDIELSEDVRPGQDVELVGQVTKASEATELMEAAISLEGDETLATGRIEVALNPPPKTMLSSEQIRKDFSHLNLTGKVVVITGASRGIGETTAKLLAALGAKVVVNYYRGEADAQAIVQDIQSGGADALALQCDVTDDESVKDMINRAMNAFGRLDILVNNAVRDFSPKNITELEWSDFVGEFDVSIKGLHACCREVIPIFKQNGGGKIINLSTVAVDNPVAGQSRYITAKSAVVGYTKSLAKELLKFNIQANLVVPNMTDTDLVSVLPTMYRDKIAQSRPYGRHVQPIEVAQSIAFLASSWSDAITGQKIVLNLGEPPFA